ncbi:tail fiber protein [Pectobacterium quasiaquaticum]|uniref:Tail fiber protein n=1 Tax=Pectobacterium quasiaquaticum TaxID=2774015 RepID=A0A9Q2EU87_9GAMM|nr:MULTISPECIES: tail fiber protein [Pectobacterium]MBE5204736.1 tail fiber protein [Pectobacterium quasiaquaticum]MBE5212180.1 tail fiber protein [Pectobacterium quasiaquaticum]MBE5215900.1 tail fiber protein [Pectobacterium quasiaquaticum]MBE5223348.1 tail fiber protein [Pectobacterium quasiaquaticum]MBE5225331.1 tail fiber protein [Pectobacterium quasiaquaticum]
MMHAKKIFTQTSITVVMVGGILWPQIASACGSEEYIGSVCYTAAQFCPSGFVPADGRALTIQQNSALYSLLSTTYGGDGKATFNVPDLRGRFPLGQGSGSADSNNIGAKAGKASVTLLNNQIAPHIHPAVFTQGESSVDVTVPAQPSTLSVGASLPLVTTASGTATTTPIPTGTSNYLGALTAKAINGLSSYNVSFTGLFSQTKPSSVTASAPVDTTVSGSAGTPAFTFKVPTGGAVSVQPNLPAAAPVDIRPQSLTLLPCIAVLGLYPPRD